VTTERIRSAAELRLMAGAPPFDPERLVTLANWQEPPFNRWGFQHVAELIPTARIPHGDGPVWDLPRRERDLSDLSIGPDGDDLDTFLERSYTDSILVVRDDAIVSERYVNAMRPDSRHLLMSVSKSVTSAVCGVLVDRGALSPTDLVTKHLPELVVTSWGGWTVRGLLAMRAGTRFDEDYANPKADVRVYEQIYKWRPRSDAGLPDDITAYYAMLENAGPHGGPFDYRSILTDVLAWVMERAAGERLHELIARELWQAMGAEFDAEITLDGRGNPMADGGISCTLRDLARFGLLLRDRGRRDEREVIPPAWIDDTLTPDADTVEAFESSLDAREFPRGAYYRNQFWVIDPDAPIFLCSGINGQSVLIHGPADVVIAKFSTWPVAWTNEFAVRTWKGLVDLAEKVAAG